MGERKGKERRGAYPSWPYEEGFVKLKETVHLEPTEVILHLDDHLHSTNVHVTANSTPKYNCMQGNKILQGSQTSPTNRGELKTKGKQPTETIGS